MVASYTLDEPRILFRLPLGFPVSLHFLMKLLPTFMHLDILVSSIGRPRSVLCHEYQ